MKSIGGNNKTTPMQLLHEGQVWLAIWENTPEEAKNLRPATYCLFTSLELYMKAYLVLRNSAYADTKKLKKLGHNFKHIYQEIVKSKTNKLTREINTQINKYELREIALDQLKYPESGRVWLLDHGIEKKQHTLSDIFKDIENEISTNFDQWLNNTYPKQTEISVLTQIGYKGNPKKINLKRLSNTCSECLPSKIIILENYNYPWSQNLIPLKTCIRCKKWFNPNGMRP
jgi:HEPN domain-containing protein